MRERDDTPCRPAHVALVLLGLALAAVVAFDTLPWLRGPAPYPPEWQWDYRQGGLSAGRPAAAALAGALVLAIALARSGGRLARGLVALSALVGLGVGLSLAAREGLGPLRALMARTQSFSVTSYHTVAISPPARDPLAFLRAHAALLPELATSAKHAATHPPGPVLWYRAALAASERSPALTAALLAAARAPVPDGQPPTRQAERAAALLGTLGLALLAALTPWPLASLARGLGLPRSEAARWAAVFVMLPGPALFAGTIDAALALPVTAAAALLAHAARAPLPRALGTALAAGACGAVATLGSYGAPVFLGIAAGAAVLAVSDDRKQLARGLVLSGLAAVATLALAFGLPALLGHEPVRALTTALRIHREQYTAPRSYGLWLAFNPVDFGLFAGAPLVALAALRTRQSLRLLAARAALAPLDRFRLAVFTGLALLTLVGATRGEVGRLWVPLVPLVLVAGAGGTAATAASAALGCAACTLAMSAFWAL